jgi:hypothetical protein
MQTLISTRRLTHSLILLTAILAGQLQARETVQVAENGSERAQQHSRKQHAKQASELVENGSERTLERSRKQPQTDAVKVAENGSERTLQRNRRA